MVSVNGPELTYSYRKCQGILFSWFKGAFKLVKQACFP
jgi:hypothetical protein